MKTIKVRMPDIWVDALEAKATENFRSLEGQILVVLGTKYSLPRGVEAGFVADARRKRVAQAPPVVEGKQTKKHKVIGSLGLPKEILLYWKLNNPEGKDLSIRDLYRLNPTKLHELLPNLSVKEILIRISVAMRGLRCKDYFCISRIEKRKLSGSTTKDAHVYRMTPLGTKKAEHLLK
jgi:hypothetical protein